MRIVVVAVIAFGFQTVAFAQQPTTIPMAQFNRVTDSLIAQRNNALNAQTLCEANLGDAKDQIATFQAELDKLKPKDKPTEKK